MSGGGGSQSTNTIQKADPWSGATPYLKGGLSDLSKWYASDYGRSFFPGSTVVPFSPFTEQALGMTADRALAGSPVTTGADANAAATLRGDYLDPSSNPWLSRTFDLAAGKVRAALDSQFNANGGYGGSLHYGESADKMNDLATQIYGGNYADERNRQIQALGLSPTIAAADYTDPAQLAKVGSAYEGQAGNYLNDAMQRFNFYQNQPLDRLAQFFNIVNPVAGQGSVGQTTTTGPGGANGITNALGGLSSLAGLGNTLGLFGSGAAGAGALGAAGATAALSSLAASSPGWAPEVVAALAAFSDPETKHKIAPQDDDKVLDMVREVGSSTYEYKPEMGSAFRGPRIGPMADDFAKKFGGDGHLIPMPKLMGVLWATNVALARKVDALEKKAA